jgi:hypothetical protein
VLTDEEQAYFSSSAVLGPLSYGPGGKVGGPASPPIGQHVDITG